MRLWNYVSTFSNLTGEKLAEIYSKLEAEQSEALVPSHLNVSGSLPGPSGRDSDAIQHPSVNDFRNNRRSQQKFRSQPQELLDRVHQVTGTSEAWKHRRRGDNDSQVQPVFQHTAISNGIIQEQPSSAGILGCGPPEFRPFGNKRPNRGHQLHFPPGQGHLSELK